MRVPSAHDVLSRLPVPESFYDKKVDDQNVFDIVKHTLRVHGKYAPDYDQISDLFWRGNAWDTAQCVFDFCKQNIPYKREPSSTQTVKSPSQIVADGMNRKVPQDCKHYGLFIVGVLDSLKRKGRPVEPMYRFASDVPGQKYPKHVFGLVKTKQGDIWVDPVLKELHKYHRYYYFLDKQPTQDMALYEVSGVSDTPDDGQYMGETGIFGEQVSGPRRGGGRRAHGGGHRGGHRWGGGGYRPIYQDVVFMDYDYPDDIDEVGKLNLKKAFQDLGKGIKNTVNKVVVTNAKNLSKEVQHQQSAMKTNFTNLGKEVKKQAQAVKTNTANLGKEIKKIQPGVLLLKVSMAPSRNAFLLLVKVNLFDIAYNLYKHAQTPPGLQKIRSLWEKVGGEWAVLKNNINEGWRVYKKNHPNNVPQGWHDIAGLNRFKGMSHWEYEDAIAPYVGNYESYAMAGVDGEGQYMGVVAAAGFAAVIAAAMPVIKVFMDLFKSLGININSVKKTADGGVEQIAIHHNQNDGSGPDYSTSATLLSDGTQVLNVDQHNGTLTPPGYPVDAGPLFPNATYAVPQGTQQYVDEQLALNQIDKEIPYADSPGEHAVNVFTDWARGVKNFVENNKGVVITGAAILGIIIISRSPLFTGKKRR